jgi:hypothetical protein
VVTFVLALSSIGAGNPSATRQPGTILSGSSTNRLSASLGGCFSQEIRVTLASEQVSFCAPNRQPFNVIEDNLSDAYVAYAGLNQVKGYGIVNIRATSSEHVPGTGRPMYTSGEVAAYRQAVWKIESSKTDRLVTSGPTGIFWNETIPSIQVDLTLSISSAKVKIRSVEWYAEHNNRLWSFVLTWDTEMQNASEWEQAARLFSVNKTRRRESGRHGN